MAASRAAGGSRAVRGSAASRGPLSESEPLQPQDLVITLLGTYVRPSGDTVWSGGLVELLGELGFSHGAARVALTRLVRRGLISRVRSGRLVHYKVTSRCDRLLAEGDGRIFSLGELRSGGDAWTVVWHQIPEDQRLERSRLARRLRFLGFGSVQDSVWISPHDHSVEVDQLLDELGVSTVATVFLSRVRASDGLPALVSRAWDLSGLAERYDAFWKEFSGFVRGGRGGSAGASGARDSAGSVKRLRDSDAFQGRTRLVHHFRGFPVLDPELPEELAPLKRSRARSVQLFHTLFEGLADGSQRHFDEVTAGYVGVR